MRFGHLDFDRVCDAANYFDGTLHKNPVNTTLSYPLTTVVADLAALDGIPPASKYEIVYDRKSQRRVFAATGADGTKRYFHHKTCLRSNVIEKNFSNRVVSSAMRFVVIDQIKAYKELRTKYFTDDFICPLTNKPVEKMDITVDHVVPFNKLMADFLAEQGIATVDVGIVWDEGRAILKDTALRDAWAVYHMTHATVHLVSKEGNKERRDAPIDLKGESLFDALSEVLG